jgi:serine/threonine protein kinase
MAAAAAAAPASTINDDLSSYLEQNFSDIIQNPIYPFVFTAALKDGSASRTQSLSLTQLRKKIEKTIDPTDDPTAKKVHDLVIKIFNKSEHAELSDGEKLMIGQPYHPNIINTYGLIVKRGPEYLIINNSYELTPEDEIIGSILEKGPDKNLFDLLAEGKIDNIGQIKSIISQLIDSLLFLEDHQIQYRDLTYSNV